MTKPGVVTDHELSAKAGQNITQARFALFKKTAKLYPTDYMK
eukprot:gene30019-5946_t